MSNGVLAGLRAVFGDRVHVWSEPPYLYHDWGGSSLPNPAYPEWGRISTNV